MKFILTIGYLFLLFNTVDGQDTLRLERKPQVILKSWYPEFKEFPELKIGKNKVLFTIIPDFEKTSIRDNDINLIAKNGQIEIKETEKTNQYLVNVNKVDLAYIEFEVWFDLGNLIILLKQESKWKDIRQIYPVKDNRIMLQIIKLKVEK